VLGASVIAFAAFAPASTLAQPKRAAWRLIAYAVLALGLLAEALTLSARTLSIDPGSPGGDDVALGFQLILVGVFAAAALAFLRRAERDGDAFMTWLAVAATIRVFAGIDYSFSPSLETGWVYTGDIFRMLF